MGSMHLGDVIARRAAGREADVIGDLEERRIRGHVRRLVRAGLGFYEGHWD